MALAQQIPAGETTVNAADTQGTNIGAVTCGKLFGVGLGAMAFTVPASGNLVGTFSQYFTLGGLRGKYVLVPDDSAPSAPDTFQTASYTGTMKVTGGTGTYQGAKGTGTLICKSADAVHLNCTEHLKLTQL